MGNQVFHCIAVLAGLRPAATQLSVPETDLLRELSSMSETVTEIGVFEGLTSRRMMEKMPESGALYCIDPFIPGRLGIAYGYWITWSQTRRARRPDIKLHVIRKFSYDSVMDVQQEMDLIFIDADHSYKSVKRDWDEWSPKVKVGGRLALHDSQPMPGRCPETSGPVRLVRELGPTPSGFELQETRDTITVYRRVS
ncbi:MAG: class I SAM-dependent methyltransferase [Thermomonas sp.]|nr:class I SAM-dependent methyltransferase [Thermomonas sp.]MDI1253507.1 class I SAM-dependent methyltransferase [Thermomonas sp.]